MTIGYAVGSFDLLNVRDLDVIRQASDRCTRLVLGVHTDEAAEALDGRRPVVPLVERVGLLRHVRGVDEVVVHEESAAAAGADVVFGVDPADLADLPADAELLLPRRDTASAVLRAALGGSAEASGAEAVA